MNKAQLIDHLTTGENFEDRFIPDFNLGMVFPVIQKYLSQRADAITVQVKGNNIIIKAIRNGVLIDNTVRIRINEDTELNFLDGLCIDGFDIEAVNLSENYFLIQTKKNKHLMERTFLRDREVNKMLNTASGAVYITSRSEVTAMSMYSAVNEYIGGSQVVVERIDGAWVYTVNGEVEQSATLEDLVNDITSLSVRVVSFLGVDFVLATDAAYELVKNGVLVFISCVAQSSINVFVQTLSMFTCSQLSQFLIGVYGTVELPTYDTNSKMKVQFKDSYAYDFYSKIDSSPMPEDIVCIVGNNEDSLSRMVITDFIKTPHNPSSFMDVTFTVLDVYSALRLTKWESMLDKAMPLVKEKRIGLDTVDKFIGKI